MILVVNFKKILLFSDSVWYGKSIFCYFPSPNIICVVGWSPSTRRLVWQKTKPFPFLFNRTLVLFYRDFKSMRSFWKQQRLTSKLRCQPNLGKSLDKLPGQPCHIYYNLYNILYGTERHTIYIKVGKIYYKMSNSELYYKGTRKNHSYAVSPN